ncbi:carboxypeptidase regulatory-like domain-containing protein [Planctomicrobium sp. SH661]|uniref:carboxypeptidase regulatory-like domain-containing protein n=1 Tax=Planctomicrobium sp. SH661 TaxID=3448124 RepID=UPI003F5B7F14
MFGAKMSRFLKLSVLLTATLCLLPACRQSGPALGKVYGIVKLDGQPLADAQLLFIPASGGRSSTGETDSNGHYQLMYSAGKAGAVIGDHQVKITSATSGVVDLTTDKVVEPARAEILPAKYHTDSELTALVKNSKNEINFDLVSK